MTCQKRFSYASTLTAHEVTNNGVKDYKYGACKGAFSQAAVLLKYVACQN